MKKTLFAAALIASFGFVAVTAPRMAGATDGSINISGTILSNTCKVGSGSPNNLTVTLPNVSASAFNGVGSYAGRTLFQVSISGCDASVSKVTTYFEPNANVNFSTNNLKNVTSGGASGVEAQILNGVGSTATPFSQIMLSQGGAAQNSGTYTLSGGAATLNYYAEFIQTASTVTAGAFSSNIQYTMQYQ